MIKRKITISFDFKTGTLKRIDTKITTDDLINKEKPFPRSVKEAMKEENLDESKYLFGMAEFGNLYIIDKKGKVYYKSKSVSTKSEKFSPYKPGLADILRNLAIGEAEWYELNEPQKIPVTLKNQPGT